MRPTGPRELAEAGYAFNRMAERLVAARADERELVARPVAPAAHPADRAPPRRGRLGLRRHQRRRLSAAELDRRRTIRRIRQAIATLEGEVDVLINTTRKAVAQEAGPEICDVSEVVRERMKFWSALAETRTARTA